MSCRYIKQAESFLIVFPSGTSFSLDIGYDDVVHILLHGAGVRQTIFTICDVPISWELDISWMMKQIIIVVCHHSSDTHIYITQYKHISRQYHHRNSLVGEQVSISRGKKIPVTFLSHTHRLSPLVMILSLPRSMLMHAQVWSQLMIGWGGMRYLQTTSRMDARKLAFTWLKFAGAFLAD